MANIINNPIFQSIVITFVFGLIFYLIQRQKKELSYKVISFNPLLSKKDGVVQQLKILYKEKQISDPHIAIVRIGNTGNLPIKSADFERPLSLIFDDSIQVFSAEISNTRPNNLDAVLNTTDSKVTLNPTLLNKRDSLDITMLTSSKCPIKADVRVVGINQIHEWKGSPSEKFITFIGIMFSVLALVFLLVSLVLEALKAPVKTFVVFGSIVFIFYLAAKFALRFGDKFKNPMDD